MKVGLMAVSAKPWHVGHANAVKRAASECDIVKLFVSLSDRARAGEVPILGKDMQTLWDEVIERSLPSNVEVIYGGSPVGNVWKVLEEASKSDLRDSYAIYADADDLAQNFTEKQLQKYCGNLFKAGRVTLEATERVFSGTQMRAYLASGDRDAFIAHLPPEIDGGKMWDVLSATARRAPKVKRTSKRKVKGEALLRCYLTLLLGRC